MRVVGLRSYACTPGCWVLAPSAYFLDATLGVGRWSRVLGGLGTLRLSYLVRKPHPQDDQKRSGAASFLSDKLACVPCSNRLGKSSEHLVNGSLSLGLLMLLQLVSTYWIRVMAQVEPESRRRGCSVMSQVMSDFLVPIIKDKKADMIRCYPGQDIHANVHPCMRAARVLVAVWYFLPLLLQNPVSSYVNQTSGAFYKHSAGLFQ